MSAFVEERFTVRRRVTDRAEVLTRADLTPGEQLHFDRMLRAVGAASATIDLIDHLARAVRRRPS